MKIELFIINIGINKKHCFRFVENTGFNFMHITFLNFIPSEEYQQKEERYHFLE